MCIAAIPALWSTLTAAGGTMGAIGTAATAASGVVGAYSSIQSSKAAAAAAEATAKQQAAAARESIIAGDQESDRQRRAGAAVLSQQKVAMAANGVDLNSASALELLDDTKAGIEADAFAIRKNATNQAQNYNQMAANSITEGRNAKSQGTWGAVSTLLSTGAKVGEKYSQWARKGSYA